MINSMKSSAEDIIKEIISLCWYMRGSIQYETLWNTTPKERELINDFITKRLKEQVKSRYPVY